MSSPEDHYDFNDAPDVDASQERFYICHGMIHDRITGRHVTTAPDEETWNGGTISDACDLLNELTGDNAERLTRAEREYARLYEQHLRLVRRLDVALNGEEGAAQQAVLVDILAQVEAMARKLGHPLLDHLPSNQIHVIATVRDNGSSMVQLHKAHTDKPTAQNAVRQMQHTHLLGEHYQIISIGVERPR